MSDRFESGTYVRPCDGETVSGDVAFVEQKDGLDVEGFRKAVLAQVNKDFPDWGKYINQIRAVK